MIDFPVLDERAEVVYQRAQRSTKRTVVAEGMETDDLPWSVSRGPRRCGHIDSVVGSRRRKDLLIPLRRWATSSADGFWSMCEGSSSFAPIMLASQLVARGFSESNAAHPPSRRCWCAQVLSTMCGDRGESGRLEEST